MPLKVSEKYSEEDASNSKSKARTRLQRKMIRNVRRPTGDQVNSDAARILEELLLKRIDDDLQGPHKVRRNKTDPDQNSIKVCIDQGGQSVARSKTMPSKYRQQSRDEPLNKNVLEHMTKLAEKKKETADDGSGEEDSGVMDSKKKKSYFKRAKERLMHTFHRDEKERIEKSKDKPAVPSPTKRRKLKSKKGKGKVTSETVRRLDVFVNKDKDVHIDEEVEHRDNSGSIHKETHSHHKEKSVRPGSFITNFIRSGSKGRRCSKDSTSNGVNRDPRKSSNGVFPDLPSPMEADNSSISPQTPNSSPPGPSIPQSPSSNRATTPNSPTPTVSQDRAGPGTDKVSLNPSPHSTLSVDAEKLTEGSWGKCTDGSVSSSSVLPRSDLSLPRPDSTNILDSPGDDIQFMDADVSKSDEEKPTDSKWNSRVKFHGSAGLLNLSWLADHANQLEMQIDERTVSTEDEDGNVEVSTSVTATVVMSDIEEDGEDVYDGASGDADKEEAEKEEKDQTYGKIAAKLIEMADAYSASQSDHESRGAEAAPSLTDLEKRIIACIRNSGDRNSTRVDEEIEDMKTAARQDAYERFRSTVQNSMGEGTSWDELAFLFYTTKEVVKAVGRGTKAANQAKEFTLQYISDTFASWIMDQGGFDSMLSSCESDYELD